MQHKLTFYLKQFLPSPLLGVTLLAIVSSVIVAFVRDMIFIPMSAISKEYNFVHDLWFTGLFAIYILAISVGQLFWGLLSQKFHHYSVFRAGMLLLFVSSALVPWASELYQLLILRFAQGLGLSCQIVMGRILIFHTGYNYQRLAQSFSLGKGLVLLTAVVSPLTTSVVSTYFSWQFNCVLVGCFSLLMYLLSFIWKDDSPADAHAIDNDMLRHSSAGILTLLRTWLSIFWQLWQYRDYRFYAFVGLLGYGLIGSFFALSNLIFLKQLNLDIQTYGALNAFYMLTAGVGVMCNSWLVHRYDTKKVLYVNLLIVTTIYTIWEIQILLQGIDIWVSGFCLMGISFFISCITANAMALGVHDIPKNISGYAFSQLGVINYFFVSFMSMITGLLLTYHLVWFLLLMFVFCATIIYCYIYYQYA